MGIRGSRGVAGEPEVACCTSLCDCSEWLAVGRESYDFISQNNTCLTQYVA